LARGFDGGGVNFDADELANSVGEFDAEEADAAVGVHEELSAAVAEAFADGLDEFGEEKEIVLEEGIAWDDPAFWRDAKGDFEAAFGRRVKADVLDLGAEGGFGDGAFLDVDDEAIVGADVAEVEALFEFVPLAADHDAIAVAIGRRTGDDGGDDFAREAAEALEEVGNLLMFDFELGGVGEVLVLTAAAFTEVAALGRDALGRGFEDLEEFGARETFFYFGEFDFNQFSERDEGNEDHEVGDTADAFAAEGDVVNAEGEPRAWSERIGWRR